MSTIPNTSTLSSSLPPQQWAGKSFHPATKNEQFRLFQSFSPIVDIPSDSLNQGQLRVIIVQQDNDGGMKGILRNFSGPDVGMVAPWIDRRTGNVEEAKSIVDVISDIQTAQQPGVRKISGIFQRAGKSPVNVTFQGNFGLLAGMERISSPGDGSIGVIALQVTKSDSEEYYEYSPNP